MMKNLTPQSTPRLAAIFFLAAGVLTGSLLPSDVPHGTPAATMAIDPTIPALVVVGKRMTPRLPVAPAAAPVGSQMTGQEAPQIPHATAQIAGAAGI